MCCENVRLRTLSDVYEYLWVTHHCDGHPGSARQYRKPFSDAGYIERARNILGLEWPVVMCETFHPVNVGLYLGGPSWFHSNYPILTEGMQKRSDVHYINIPMNYCPRLAEFTFWHELTHGRQMELLTPAVFYERALAEQQSLGSYPEITKEIAFKYYSLPIEQEANTIALRYYHHTRVFR